jgi:hypothetical protein
MFSIFFIVLLVMALLSICGEIVMRVRLTRSEASGEKLVWWRRGGDEVAGAYEALFPRSRLLLVRRFPYWLIIVCAGVVLVSILWRLR